MPTTFVTAFLNLGEDRSKDKSVEKCFSLFAQLVATGINLHLFLSKSYKDIYDELIGSPTNVVIEYIELNELDIYREVQNTPYGLPQIRTEHHDTRNFMILMNGKIEFVHRAMKTRDSTHYAWIDFSLFHVIKDVKGTSAYLTMLGSSALKDGLYMPGCWGPGEPSFASVCWRFCGGFFIGDKHSLETFYTSTHSLFNSIIYIKGLAWEVNIWAWLEHIGHLNCKWYKADHNDSIVRVPTEAFKVVASLTTIPPRESECRLAIDSILGQVDHIYISVSHEYKRFGPWTPPAYLQEEPYKSKVTLQFGEDRGPATKYVGALGIIPKDVWVFICDDDQEYHPTLLSRMKEGIQDIVVYQNHYESIKRKTSGGMIHGYVGLLVHSSLLQGLIDVPLPPSAYFVDDQWMSIYCFNRAIRICKTKAETYTDIYGTLDGWHEKIGTASLASLNNRDEMIAILSKEFGVTFDKEIVCKI
jgi:hypothetical protein